MRISIILLITLQESLSHREAVVLLYQLADFTEIVLQRKRPGMKQAACDSSLELAARFVEMTVAVTDRGHAKYTPILPIIPPVEVTTRMKEHLLLNTVRPHPLPDKQRFVSIQLRTLKPLHNQSPHPRLVNSSQFSFHICVVFLSQI